jgi:4-hydroxybenzoate polyprenyltransferase
VTAGTHTEQVRGFGRWIVYQRERFPVLGHGPLIAAFSSGAVCFSAQLRAADSGGSPTIAVGSLVVAFVSCLLFFFQLRVSDEFKDFEDDSRWRAYRPVPRGLVTLSELRWLAIAAMGVQLLAALLLAPRLVLPLIAVWVYIWLMTIEFGVRQWIHDRPFAVLWTHMLIMPFIDFYATASDWMATGDGDRALGMGLAWFLLASYFNGVVVEVGRKIRAPADEETGVVTYSAAWGRGRAVAFWLVAIVLTAACAALAAREIGAMRIVLAILGVLGLLAAIEGTRLVVSPQAGRGKRLEILSGLWTIAMYLSVGVIPLFFG